MRGTGGTLELIAIAANIKDTSQAALASVKPRNILDPMEAKDLDPSVALMQLSSAPDDPSVSSAEYQRGLVDLLQSLRANGIVVSASYAAGGPGLSGEFVIRAASLGSAFERLISRWIMGRYGRKALLRIGSFEAEAQTADEVSILFQHVREHQRVAS